jgi:GT2 family glycosyltransferase
VSSSPAVAGPPRSLSVVLCAYTLERWDDICAAVESLRAQSRPVDQVVLVADHNDELLARARAAFPEVACLPNAEGQGLSGARNTGVRAATGDVVAFLDDDAAADPGWAAGLMAPYADDPAVVGTGGRVVPAWRAPRPAWFPEEFLWVVGCSYAGLPEGRAEVRNPIGASMSFRRSVFEGVGGFDATMGRMGKDAAGCEETEFSIRARRGGGRVVLEPSSVCRHAVTPDRVTRGYFRRRCRAEGRSKALVSRLAGQEEALSTERTYVTRTLPRGVLRGLGALFRGDVGGLGRAWAIVEGTTLTVLSYTGMRLRLALRRA